MGAINYFTSDYITLGVKPYNEADFENDADFLEIAKEYNITIDEYVRELYDDDRANIEVVLEKYSFEYYTITIKYGYYEGFTLNIENNLPVYFDDWKEKREAQKEVTRVKECLYECAGTGLVACYPGWCTGYDDYKETIEEIGRAIYEMRKEIKNTPTYETYRRGEIIPLF